MLCTLTTGFHTLERFHTGTGTVGSLNSKPQNLFDNIRPWRGEEAYNNEQDTTCRVIPIKKDKKKAVNTISPPQLPIFLSFLACFSTYKTLSLKPSCSKNSKIFRAYRLGFSQYCLITWVFPQNPLNYFDLQEGGTPSHPYSNFENPPQICLWGWSPVHEVISDLWYSPVFS